MDAGHCIGRSLLLLGGGLQALQTATIASALPFAIALLGAFWGFGRAILADGAKRDAHSTHTPPAMAAEAGASGFVCYWIIPMIRLCRRFNATHTSCHAVFRKCLAERGVAARVITEDDALSVRLEVSRRRADFSYEVRARLHPMPDASLSAGTSGDKAASFYRAEVHLAEGGQDYDVMGWSQEQVIVDILNQYEDHLHFLHTVR